MLVIQTKCNKFLCGFFENSGKLVYMKKQSRTNVGSVTEFLENSRMEFPDMGKADLIGVTCLGGMPELMRESLIFAKVRLS
ncbi:unnamed protein product [Blepharisma stoltei]|uniref:Uncharacterized protein n=1 Tax=Blepharisma stoltei TaxID=1481888 RepID=A0AAU9JKF9_9CILI|nr:unnamed protein product [Blepharisma stoltei]